MGNGSRYRVPAFGDGFTGVQERTRQHPAPAAKNQPGSLVPGQQPAPSYPPVPSPPEFQSLGSSETTEREIGTVAPMRVRPGSMLGKGCGESLHRWSDWPGQYPWA